jgi:hypothetical protein
MISGVCRICKCTAQTPCVSELEGWEGGTVICGWMDLAQTLCSNPRCIAVIPLDDLVDICFPRKAAAAAAR